jgi:DNA ligase-1
MRAFADLYDALDRTTSTNEKVDLMSAYFADAEPVEGAWAVFFLTGRRLKQVVSMAAVRRWAAEVCGVPGWLFDESYSAVGDSAETVALMLDTLARERLADAPEPGHTLLTAGPLVRERSLADWLEARLLPLRRMPACEQRAHLLSWWRRLERRELYILIKLLSGALRVGVSQTLVQRALAQAAGRPADAIAHGLMGDWQPSAAFMNALLARGAEGAGSSAPPLRNTGSHPYPFLLASPLEQPPGSLGEPALWQAEWKLDGIRAQLIRRDGGVHLWSRGEELITDRFPEVARPAAKLPPGTVLDGELLAFDAGKPLPFAVLQKRIGRRKLSANVLAEAPVSFIAYDLLERDGADLRPEHLTDRRAALESLLSALGHPALRLSEVIRFASWDELSERRRESRARGVEGVMLKRRASPYGAGRFKGDWWKWKIEPYSIDAVLVYAQPGSGRRASLLTDYTFAVRDGQDLVPVAKAYSGLDHAEIVRLDGWIRQHTTGRFGPVRVVEPVHVFEIAFEGLQESTRHRAGIALRFPRILRWRTDKAPAQADTLESVRELLRATR